MDQVIIHMLSSFSTFNLVHMWLEYCRRQQKFWSQNPVIARLKHPLGVRPAYGIDSALEDPGWRLERRAGMHPIARDLYDLGCIVRRGIGPSTREKTQGGGCSIQVQSWTPFASFVRSP